MNKFAKKILCYFLVVACLFGTLFINSVNINTLAATTQTESVVWDGSTATAFAGGNGTKANPYIIKTPMQLYKMVADGGKSAGAYSYYKIADGIDVMRLSEHSGKLYSAIKAAGDAVSTSATAAQKNWIFTNAKTFEGHFDGNGAVISGMISKSASGMVGLIPRLGKGAVVKNIIFDGCYAKTGGSSAGLLSGGISEGTRSGYTLIDSVAVINSYIKGSSYTGGVFGSGTIPDTLAFVNCLFDGKSCNTDITAGIFGAPNWTNRFQLYNCVSIGAKLAPKLTAYNENGVKYNNYNDVTVPTIGTGVVSDVHPIFISNCYSDTPIDYASTEIDADRLKEIGYTVDFSQLDTAEKLMSAMSLLDWQNDWYVAERADGTLYPMIKKNTADIDILGTESTENKPVLDYNKLLGTQSSLAGANMDGPYENGTYGYFYAFEGSGTKADPYIIKDALGLARAIGSGGKNIDQKLYFKLGCDIDLQGFKWLNAVGWRSSIDTNSDGKNDSLKYDYKYIAFEGFLDGDGHTVTGLYAIAPNGTEAIFNTSYNAGADMDYLNYAGLIPVLNGGTVKNLHIRDSYIGSGSSGSSVAGAVAGYVAAGSTILGCSVENTTVVAHHTNFLTGNSASPKNSYIITDESSWYFDAYGQRISNLDNIDYSTGVWYKGGTDSSVPRLVNQIQASSHIDFDGDGVADEYTAADIVALKNHLMWKDGYESVYGDIDKNGITDITDLAILQRYMAGDYNKITDGFWRNVELGKIEIFYGENDNYDAARKIELYLENVYPDVDIKKYVNNTDNVYKHTNDGVKSPDGKLDIVVGYIDGTDYALDSSIGTNQYRIKYDSTNRALWLQGDSFTAVYQAVLDFIAADMNSAAEEPSTSQIYTLSAEKQPVKVDGKTYYYAWGDEFNGTEDDGSGLSYGNWSSREAHAERTNGSSSAYRHQEYAPVTALNKLITVNGGKLTINRGYRIGAAYGGTVVNTTTAGYDGYIGLTDEEIGTANGMGAIDSTDKYFNAGSLSTANTMVFKKGYVEIMASLPADGHAFPALWLYGGGVGTAYRNRGWDNSLYSKIYSINSGWNGTDYITWSNSATQKYNIPKNFYELDIIELMQAYYRLSSGQQSQNRYIDYYGVDTTIHRWTRADSGNTSENLVNKSYNFGSPGNKYVSGYGYTKYVYSSSYADELANLQAMRKYGFLWDTTSSGTTLKTYIYNTDGSLLTTLNASLSGTDIDEYLHIIIDNEFYSSNTSAEYSGMLTTVSGKDAKVKLEVEYVRLYQLDGKRDVVTIETESFNTGNHFGY